MNLDTAYILGAGLGTRMGPVGEVLPKLLWPIFEKTLLELQIDYALNCGIKKIFLNTHFQASQIEEYVTKHNLEIEIIFEKDLLDIGGAVHNLARKLNYVGRILILNGDQFLMLNKSIFNDFKTVSMNHVATLLGLKVPADSQYNELVVSDNKLISIEKPSLEKDYYTYSGVSIINLELLNPKIGKSKFFDSVADFKNHSVLVYKPTDFEYWDFGTTERYLNSMKKVITSNDSRFKEFLITKNAFKEDKLNESFCYNAKGKEFSINLEKKFLNNGYGNVLISGEDIDLKDQSIVVYKNKYSTI